VYEFEVAGGRRTVKILKLRIDPNDRAQARTFFGHIEPVTGLTFSDITDSAATWTGAWRYKVGPLPPAGAPPKPSALLKKSLEIMTDESNKRFIITLHGSGPSVLGRRTHEALNWDAGGTIWLNEVLVINGTGPGGDHIGMVVAYEFVGIEAGYAEGGFPDYLILHLPDFQTFEVHQLAQFVVAAEMGIGFVEWYRNNATQIDTIIRKVVTSWRVPE
jgi:hypothetical protein